MATLSNYALRLQTSLLNELRAVAEAEGTSINQLINVAVAEKLAALRTEQYFRERMRRAGREGFLAILERAGADVEIEGDELPQLARFDRLVARMAEKNAHYSEEEVAADVAAAHDELDQ